MCFNPPMSMSIGAVSWCMALWLGKKDGGMLSRRALMFWYFGFIEFLQLSQYMVADQCSNNVNKALTYLAYMHVAFQPLVVNNFFWSGFKTTRPDLVKFILRLSLCGGVMMLFRLPGMPLGYLGDLLNKWVPDLPTSDMHGKSCGYLEASCSPKLCSITGGGWGHISWEVPLLPSTYFVPGASMHAILFFLPTLLMADGPRWWLMIACLIMGPLVSQYFSSLDMATYQFEWPTIWCFFAAVQTMVAFIVESRFPHAFSAPAPPAGKAAASKGAAIKLTADGSAAGGKRA